MEIGLEDRFQNELQGSLDHAVSNGGDREHPDLFSVLLSDLHSSIPHRLIRTLDQFGAQLLDKGLPASHLDLLERDPIDSRGSVVFLSDQIGGLDRLHLADVPVQAPKAPGRLGLRLDIDPPSQVLQTDGRLYHLTPAFLFDRGVTEQQGPLAPRALPRFFATTDPAATLSPWADFPVVPVIRPTFGRSRSAAVMCRAQAIVM